MSEKKDITLTVMLELQHEGRSLIVPFTIKKESGKQQYNVIDSIYDKDARHIGKLWKGIPYEEYFLRNAEGNLLYIDREKAREWAKKADEENRKNRSEAQSASITKITNIESLTSKLEAFLQNDSFMDSISTEADLDKLLEQHGNMRYQSQENRQPRGAFDAATRIIHLFETADRSTLLHECGHAFLQELQDYIRSGKADERSQSDWAELMDWLGCVCSSTGSACKSMAILPLANYTS